MHKVSEVIVVEGRYDKNTLSQVVDAVIIETSGFGVFNNKEKQQLLRTLAEKRGLIVMTDPDGAGAKTALTYSISALLLCRPLLYGIFSE